jgi:hypothetical protein
MDKHHTILPHRYSGLLPGKKKINEALRNYRWILDLSRGLQPKMIEELTRLAALLDEVDLNDELQDTIKWCFDA